MHGSPTTYVKGIMPYERSAFLGSTLRGLPSTTPWRFETENLTQYKINHCFWAAHVLHTATSPSLRLLCGKQISCRCRLRTLAAMPSIHLSITLPCILCPLCAARDSHDSISVPTTAVRYPSSSAVRGPELDTVISTPVVLSTRCNYDWWQDQVDVSTLPELVQGPKSSPAP